MSTTQIKGLIRRMFEAQLKRVLVENEVFLPGTTDLAVEWNGLSIDRPKLLKDSIAQNTVGRMVSHSMVYGPDLIIEMGPNPRVEGGGHAKFGIFTRAGIKNDYNDDLTAIVAYGFPLYDDLSLDGFNVRIDKQETGEIVQTDGWAYSPLRVNWNVWRA